MATFSDDFSTRTGTATVSAPTGISGYTLFAPSGSASYISAQIVTDATAIGGKLLRLQDSGWGGGPVIITPDAIGSVAAGTETEILVGFRLGLSNDADSPAHGRMVPAMLRTTDASASPVRIYGVGYRRTASTSTRFQGWYFQGVDDWSNLGPEKTLSPSLVANDRWWVRLHVTAAGSWSWKVWKDGASEPGWDATGTSDTTRTSGYVGAGAADSFTRYDPLDIEWMSVGTGADAAPMPGGAVIDPGVTFGQQPGHFGPTHGFGFGY